MVIYDSSDIELVRDRLKRNSVIDEEIISSVRKIVSDVEKNGDSALFKYTKMFDGFAIDKENILVSKDEIADAYSKVPQELLETIKKSASNIESFHVMQKREGFEKSDGGAVTGSLILPMKRAGVYVPGGKAAYPSSVLMNIIPAKIAGVEEIIMVTPPGKTGKIEPLTLVAADIAGADKVFRIGGAQAIAALAYGTESIPKTDVITGPGNAYVAAAKREVFGAAGIDMIAGPSEVLIIADETANARYIAADLLSQAEHDERAASILLTISREVALSVSEEVEIQLDRLPRKDIAEKSIDDYGTIVVVSCLNEAFDIANDFAPEHLEILTFNPRQYLNKVRNAGAVFLGEYSPEPLGDYFAGPNHILPTSGTARFSSPLSVDDFVKRINYVSYDRPSLEACYKDIKRFALTEGLEAHARSAVARFEEEA